MALIRKFKTTLRLLRERNFRNLYLELVRRAYRNFYTLPFLLVRGRRRLQSRSEIGQVKVQTEHPLAFESPDHLFPFGTKNDNNTNRRFVLLMDKLVGKKFPGEQKSFLDLGCAGGQLVEDFFNLGWLAVGLEGSDYSLRHRRASWKRLANRNLFTADIGKPFRVLKDGREVKFHLITAWEVLEHINKNELDNLFKNIVNSLQSGGYFFASASGFADVRESIDFHQTKMTPLQWRDYILKSVPQFAPEDLGLKWYQLVRYAEPPFLSFKKK